MKVTLILTLSFYASVAFATRESKGWPGPVYTKRDVANNRFISVRGGAVYCFTALEPVTTPVEKVNWLKRLFKPTPKRPQPVGVEGNWRWRSQINGHGEGPLALDVQTADGRLEWSLQTELADNEIFVLDLKNGTRTALPGLKNFEFATMDFIHHWSVLQTEGGQYILRLTRKSGTTELSADYPLAEPTSR